MQARPAFAPFGVTDPSRLDPYLERRRFTQGDCLMAGRPRSASAYAHIEVVASRLSAERLRALCGNDPQTGLAVLRALGEDAATKARQTSQHLEEFVFSDHIDPSVDHMVAAAAAAVRAEELAAATVAETGIGDVVDKTYKNRFASLEMNRSLQGKPGVGRWSTDERGVTEIASPVGWCRTRDEVWDAQIGKVLLRGCGGRGRG